MNCVYVDGCKVQSAFFSTNTKPIFRSESARYILFIQMSKEMWDFDSEGSGEIMFNKVVNGFLPALFKKWASLKAKHLVSMVLFTRVEYDTGLTSELAASIHDSAYHTGIQIDGNKKPYKDFYRVVVSEMASGSWTTILYQLKREFKFFRKDVSMHRIEMVTGLESQQRNGQQGGLGTRIEAKPSLSMYGNVLEAINLASSQFSHDYIDRDLMRTGISIVVITPSPGIFEVDYETLRITTETLIGNGIGIDLVCLPKMPLHSVPLFKYRNPQYASFQEAVHFQCLQSEDSTPRQNAALFGSSFSSLSNSLSPTKVSGPIRSARAGSANTVQPPSEWNYAIPHWIDVSFWTGASQDHFLLSPSTKGVKKYLLKFNTQRSTDFAIRCKMYEMEMASVMENAMNEISVAPLQYDALFPQMILGPQEVLVVAVEDQNKPHYPEWIDRNKIHTSLLEFVAGPSKPLIDRDSTQDFRKFYESLSAFDLSKSETQPEYPMPRQKAQGKKSSKTGTTEGTRKALADDSKVFGTSLTDVIATPKGVSLMQTAMSERNKSDSQTRGDPIYPRRDSVGNSMVTIMKTQPLKPPKLGRQISLGKNGFGIAAPKAIAAEIQTEHVSAAKPSSSTTKALEVNKARPRAMPNHLLNIENSQSQERPSSSQSEKSKRYEGTSQEIGNFDGLGDKEKSPMPSAKPIAIKNASRTNESTSTFKSRSALGSYYESLDRQGDPEESHMLQSMRPDDGQKLFNSKLLAGSVPELPTTLSPTTALSPWLNVLNPSNPTVNYVSGSSQNRRWQHVFPRPIHTKTMKWKSLCSPASVPLTTESFPTKYQLDTEYQQKPYNISQNADDELNEYPRTTEDFLCELVGLRLSQGFQIVVGPAVAEAFGRRSIKTANIFDSDRIAEDGASVFMSLGNTVHQLSYVNGTEVEVNMFVRKPTVVSSPSSNTSTIYNPAIRTTLADQYESRKIILGKQRDEYNWNFVDTFIAGFEEEMSESLRFWRARFVLIPVERPTQSQRRQDGDNEEEIRLEGIKKLTQMWQRHRVLSASERRFQSLASRKTKDPNPLDIVYKTEDPSVVVTAELETLPLVEGEGVMRRGHLLESERFRKSNLDIPGLAEAIQAPVEKGGVRMQNRRWHFRLHYNCFIGSDMTTWLIENFEDIETREEAVEVGNILMAKDEQQRLRDKDGKENSKEKFKDAGIFVHVEKRHPFRDGQYFYQVTGDFAKQRPESRSGWFATRRRDNSIPSTPILETRDLARPERSRSSSTYDEKSPDSGTTTPMTVSAGQKKPKVSLSKMMKYDVDHRKRSYRPERINLHYDRLHNPDNCYHIRIDWMGVTAKLIEDAIESWAAIVERYGLRLVEAPIGEASTITEINPFRSPYIIKLAAQPPDQQPRTYFDVNSFAPQDQASPASRHYYQKAIMKKFNFVLDIEAARNFPSNVDVTYSWGRPDFKYTQFIHRSGVVLAQITDDGDILLLANWLYNNRMAAAREMDRYVKSDNAERGNRMTSTGHGHCIGSDKASPFNSPMLRPTKNQNSSPLLRATSDVLGPSLLESKAATAPESVKNEIESFCHDASGLETFYKEVYEKATPPSVTPPGLKSPCASSLLDSNIPTLGLPPGILSRDTSPSPIFK